MADDVRRSLMPDLLLPPIINAEDAARIDTAIWCDVRWYLDGSDGQAAYEAEHITGAIFVDMDVHLADHSAVGEGRHPMPSAAAFAAGLGELGIGPGDPVIAYDDRQGVPAGRMVWMLRAIGHEAALLDGGLHGWDGDRSSVVESRPPTSYPSTQWPALLADADTTAIHGASLSAVVIDARAGDRFRGETEPMDTKAGHIPGAINLPYAANLDSSGRFLPADELRQRFIDAGVADADVVVNYCGSGVSACHNLLAVERAGLGPAKLFPGSWSAWSSDPSRPVATGE